MKTIISLELKKVLRNRLWQLSVAVCLLLSIFCLFLEKETSELPVLRYPAAAEALRSEEDSDSVEDRQRYYAGLKTKYDLAQEFYSKRMIIRMIPVSSAEEEAKNAFDEQTSKECRELLQQGIQKLRLRLELITWYDSYYSSLVNYQQMTEDVLTSLDTATPFSAGQTKSQKEQTRNLYTSLQNQKLSDSSWLFWEMYSQSLVNLFWLAAVIITVMIFLESDERAKMTEVIHTGTSSFRRLFLYRFSALVILLSGLTAVFILTGWAACAFLYGFPSWHMAVQSVPSFYSCPYSWSVAQWFGIRWFLQTVQAVFAGVFLTFLHLVSGRRGYPVFFLLLAVSALITLLLGSYTWLEWLRRINLYTLLLPEYWFSRLQFFGDLTSDAWSCFLLLLLMAVCLGAEMLFPPRCRVPGKRKHIRRLPFGSGAAVVHQIHLLTIHNPCLMLFLMAALFAAGNCGSVLVRNSESAESAELAEVCREYGGPLTKKKARLITEKYAGYQKLDEELQKADIKHIEKELSDEDYIQLLDMWQQENQDRWIWETLYSDLSSGKDYLGFGSGYQMLLGLNTTERDEKNALLAVLLILLLCGSLFSAEHRHHADDLFRTTQGNTKRLRLKLAVAAGAGFLIFLFVYGMDFLQAADLYPLDDWNLPLASVLPLTEGAIRVDPSLLQMTVGQAYLGVLITRLLGVLTCLFLVLICSIAAETPVESLLTGLSVLAIGWLLIQAGMEQAALVSPRWLLEGNLAFLQKRFFWSFPITGALFFLVWLLYSKNQRLFKRTRT